MLSIKKNQWLLVFIGATMALHIKAAVPSQQNWSSVTKNDLEQTHQSIERVVPYTFFQSMPSLMRWLNEGYQQARHAASQAHSKQDYQRIMRAYIQGFNIEHLSLVFPQPKHHQAQDHTQAMQVTTQPFTQHGVWITLPSFQDEPQYGHPNLTKSLDQLIHTIPHYRTKKIIVFDVRSNGGGDEKRARPLIVALYSKAYLESLGPSFIWNQKWIALDSLAPEASQFFNGASMLRAAKQGYRLYETGFWPVNYGQKNIQHPSKKPNPVKARIVILSNASCGSMCYQFTRTLLTLPGTVLVGQAPNTMDRLTNPVAVPLASHKAILYLGTREMISPGYAFGHALIPSFRYEGNLSNTPAVKQWILRLYKRKKI